MTQVDKTIEWPFLENETLHPRRGIDYILERGSFGCIKREQQRIFVGVSLTLPPMCIRMTEVSLVLCSVVPTSTFTENRIEYF